MTDSLSPNHICINTTLCAYLPLISVSPYLTNLLVLHVDDEDMVFSHSFSSNGCWQKSFFSRYDLPERSSPVVILMSLLFLERLSCSMYLYMVYYHVLRKTVIS